MDKARFAMLGLEKTAAIIATLGGTALGAGAGGYAGYNEQSPVTSTLGGAVLGGLAGNIIGGFGAGLAAGSRMRKSIRNTGDIDIDDLVIGHPVDYAIAATPAAGIGYYGYKKRQERSKKKKT